jgi:hypothetical protein
MSAATRAPEGEEESQPVPAPGSCAEGRIQTTGAPAPLKIYLRRHIHTAQRACNVQKYMREIASVEASVVCERFAFAPRRRMQRGVGGKAGPPRYSAARGQQVQVVRPAVAHLGHIRIGEFVSCRCVLQRPAAATAAARHEGSPSSSPSRLAQRPLPLLSRAPTAPLPLPASLGARTMNTAMTRKPNERSPHPRIAVLRM